MIIHDVEQGSPEWFALRAGMPTSSNAKKLVTSQGKESKSMPEYAIELAGDLYAGQPLNAFEGNAWTDRGTELEDSARSLYEMVNDVEAQTVGFITDDDQQHGASPDNLIGEDGGLEIKCLKATNHIKAIMYYKKNKKPPTDYVSQVQSCLFETGRKWWDLMFFHPDLPELIIRIEPDLEFHKVLESQLKAVIIERDKIVKLLNEN
jgi:hypothetical protein